MASLIRFHAVVPAAGIGARVGSAVPKQYLPIAGRTLLQWSVASLLAAPFIEQVLVVVAPGDGRAHDQVGDWPRVQIQAAGGPNRRDSVLGGLRSRLGHWSADDWVLVHDAARPGLGLSSLQRLHDCLRDDPVGGLLALPVSDTVKQGEGDDTPDRRNAGPAPLPRVSRTISRDGLWLAQTPQMFRFGLLLKALEQHPNVTDEASAIEAAGLRPRLVDGDRHNFKITTADDLQLMAAWLEARRHPSASVPGQAGTLDERG